MDPKQKGFAPFPQGDKVVLNIELELIVIHEKALAYDVIFGFKEILQNKFSLNHEKDPPCFHHNGKDTPIYQMKDKFDEEYENEDGVLTVEQTKEQQTIYCTMGITLMGNDVYFLPVQITSDAAGLYEVSLDEELSSKGLKLEGPSKVAFIKSG